MYIDPRNNNPFYVGKGKGQRLFDHLREARKIKGRCTSHRINKIRGILKEGLEPIIKKVKENLAEQEAYSLEKDLIESIGRRNLGVGPLINVIPGGDGFGDVSGINNGMYGRHHSEETRKKIANRHYPTGKDHRLFGKKRSKETCRKMSEGNQGRRQTEESNRKRSATLKGRKKPEGFAAKISELKKGNTNILGKHIYTPEKKKKRTKRMINRVIDLLIENKIEVNEDNFNNNRVYNNYPLFKNIHLYYSEEEFQNLFQTVTI